MDTGLPTVGMTKTDANDELFEASIGTDYCVMKLNTQKCHSTYFHITIAYPELTFFPVRSCDSLLDQGIWTDAHAGGNN